MKRIRRRPGGPGELNGPAQHTVLLSEFRGHIYGYLCISCFALSGGDQILESPGEVMWGYVRFTIQVFSLCNSFLCEVDKKSICGYLSGSLGQ
ncbi:hypothetical protein ACN38_g9457 [Penicillium nordicum]|uniref:Uncharacterized protein n=1 Tax=Penicillium nordicum TaxID=229535 RepID=A0A0M9WCJ3_9EURO|nr:hypothetical protein ACN38_g9457 [Penicillium nordicum]